MIPDLMGETVYPPPEFYPPGLDCEDCTPSLFPSGKWPSRLLVKFSGIIACAGSPRPPNDRWIQLIQTADACNFHAHFSIAGISYYCRLSLRIAQLWLKLEDLLPADSFLGQADPCSLVFPTNLCQCPPNAGRLGFGHVTDAPTPLTSYLCGSCHFFPWQKTRSESQLVGMDHTLVRLANKKDHSRCHFYIDNEDTPL